MAGPCESGNKLWDSIKSEKFLDQLSNCKFLKKDTADLRLLIVMSTDN
jgi:hypothetical protein